MSLYKTKAIFGGIKFRRVNIPDILDSKCLYCNAFKVLDCSSSKLHEFCNVLNYKKCIIRLNKKIKNVV